MTFHYSHLKFQQGHLKEFIYALGLLINASLLASRPSSTPTDPTCKFQQEQGFCYDEIAIYRRLNGSILYLTTSRLLLFLYNS